MSGWQCWKLSAVVGGRTFFHPLLISKDWPFVRNCFKDSAENPVSRSELIVPGFAKAQLS